MLSFTLVGNVQADDDDDDSEVAASIVFTDIVPNPGTGISFSRVPSAQNVLLDELKLQPFIFDPANNLESILNIAQYPWETRGWPGVALLDYDRDGDLDIYATNGPGAANSLYSNQLKETGKLAFEDVALLAGVGATDQDSSGVCFGDIDNDGDHDLVVLGWGMPNRLFENQGDGSFLDITDKAGFVSGDEFSSTCSMGDVNGDGLLDIAIGNAMPMNDAVASWLEPYALNQHNQLFLNKGSNVFEDVSNESGIRNLAGLSPQGTGFAGVTWSVAMVDYDQDGDVDIINADDQVYTPSPDVPGGTARGMIHIFNNDGTGKFTDVSVEANTNIIGAWMGLSFGDLNGDGRMDMFATNGGDYATNFLREDILGVPYQKGTAASRWFLGQIGGKFRDPGVGNRIVATPFGWGNAMFDYDNDADTDIVFYGDLDVILGVLATNPGTIFQNDGTGHFSYDGQAIPKDHSYRNVHGVAVGDLNGDGFQDIVTASGFDKPESLPTIPLDGGLGGPLALFAKGIFTFAPTDVPGIGAWSGIVYPNGTLSVEINSADNGNNWVEVTVEGTAGITEKGRGNRDGIGAVVMFTPEDGEPAMRPILGGSSHVSQHSLKAIFGLGKEKKGTIDILWPGGVKNRLYDVQASERIEFPELPCSYTDLRMNKKGYRSCVHKELETLAQAGVIDESQQKRFSRSASRAFKDTRLTCREFTAEANLNSVDPTGTRRGTIVYKIGGRQLGTGTASVRILQGPDIQPDGTQRVSFELRHAFPDLGEVVWRTNTVLTSTGVPGEFVATEDMDVVDGDGIFAGVIGIGQGEATLSITSAEARVVGGGTICGVDLSKHSHPVTFEDIVASGTVGIDYQRVPSQMFELLKELRKNPIKLSDVPALPTQARGWPGVALFDYDGDDDLDIYVTNGPGAANSLYSSQLTETGELTFIDVATGAGVAAVGQNSSGVCFGDIDNDGDKDLYVSGDGEANRLFENRGDGTFSDITLTSQVGGGDTNNSKSCSMGDINGDGLLDISVANAMDQTTSEAAFIVPFALNQANDLYLNLGGNVFEDVSESSGFRDQAFPPPFSGKPGITWAIAIVDYDLDGDQDIVTAEDQVFVLPTFMGGVDRGFIHIFQNDGTGQFTDVTFDAGTTQIGGWMSLAFADVNCDGNLDMFVSNAGDYVTQFGFRNLGLDLSILPVGFAATKWFLGQDDNTFYDPGVGSLVTIPFAWGNSAADFDNDGDTDLQAYGSIDTTIFTDATNPGVILLNRGCSGEFSYDANALAGSTNHGRRSVHGVATGDLNRDGFTDIVSVSSFDKPEPIPLAPMYIAFGSVFDQNAAFVPTFVPGDSPDELVWSGIEFPNGSLSVEINSADNHNNWVEVTAKGTIGMVEGGRNNRDGIGAVISFTPKHGNRVMKPVMGGSSHLSQHSLSQNFGLGEARRGTVEVLWPGGVRNRLYNVTSGERLVMHEIPCSFDGVWDSGKAYKACVKSAVNDLVAVQELSRKEAARFTKSAMQAYKESSHKERKREEDD